MAGAAEPPGGRDRRIAAAWRGIVVILAAVASAARAGDEEVRAALNARAAFALGDRDALAALAARDDPDPWIVADALCVRGEFDAAAAFAAAAARKETERLPAYVERLRAQGSPDPAPRRAVEAANAAIDHGRAEEVLATEPGETADEVPLARLLLARASAFEMLGRDAEREPLLARAAEACGQVGWHARRSAALHLLAAARVKRGDLAGAESLLREGADLDAGRGDGESRTRALALLALVRLRAGGAAEAAALLLAAAQAGGDDIGLEVGEAADLAFAVSAIPDRAAPLLRGIDPWHVVDELCARGAFDSALATSDAAPESDRVSLRAYVESRRGKPTNRGLIDAAAESQRLLQLRRFDDVLDVVRSAKYGENDVASICLAHVHAIGLFGKGDLRGGAELCAAAAAKAERIGWTGGAAELRQAAGLLYTQLREPARAEEQLSHRHRLHEARKEGKEAAGALRQIGDAWFQSNDYANAVPRLLRAADAAEACGDVRGAVDDLDTAAILLVQLARLEEARSACERQIALRTKLHDFLGVAESLEALALNFDAAGSYDRGLPIYERALKLREACGDRRGIAVALEKVADSLGSLGRPEAVEAFRRAIAAAKEAGDDETRYLAWHHLGTHELGRGRLAEAVEAFRAALTCDPGEVQRQVSVPSTWRWLGDALNRLGARDQAAEALATAVRLLENRDDIGELPEVLRQLALTQKARGHWNLALECLGKAERIAPPALRSAILLDRAEMDFVAGRYDAAAERIGKAVEASRAAGDRAKTCRALCDLSRVLAKAGRAGEAVARAEEALATATDDAGRVRSLEHLGTALLAAERPDEAEARFRAALDANRDRHDAPVSVRILLRIAELRRDRGRPADSLSAAREALEIARAAGNPQGCADSLHAIVLAEWASGHAEAAIEGIREGRRLRAEHPVKWIEPWELDDIAISSKAGARDLLRESAERLRGRSWSLADDLLGRGERQAAIDFAREAGEPRLAEYLATAPEGKVDAAARERFKEGVLLSNWPEEEAAALAAIPDPESPLLRAMVRSHRGDACLDLRRFEEAERDFLAAAEAAYGIGWSEYAVSSLRNAGFAAQRRADMETAKRHLEKAIAWGRAAGLDKETAIALGNLGTVFEEMDAWADARRVQEEALAIRQRIGDRKGICRSRWNLGLLCLKAHDLDAGRDHLRAALEIAEEIPDREMTAGILDSLGCESKERGDYRKALDYYDRSIGMQGVSDADRCVVYSNKATALERMGRYAEAADLLERSRTLARASNNPTQLARSTDNLALVLCRRGESRKAIALAEEAARFWRANGLRSGLAQSLDTMAMAHQNLGDYARAKELLLEALEIRRATGDRPGVAATLGSLGNAHLSMGDFAQAIECHEENLALARAMQDREGVAFALGHLASVRQAKGEARESIPLLEEALAIFRSIGARSEEASMLGDLSAARRSLGEHDAALDLQQRAAVIRGQLGDRSGEARAVAALGNCYADRGESRKAIEYYRRALPVLEEMDDRDAQATIHQNLGVVLSSLGEFAAARAEMERARAYYDEAGARADLAGILVSLGNVHLGMSEVDPAFELFGQALALGRAMGDRALEMRALGNLGSAHAARGEHRKALDLCAEALAIAEELEARDSLADLLGNMADSHRALGDFARALDFQEKALALRQALGNRRSLATGYDSFATLLHQIGDFERAAEMYRKALRICEESGDRRGMARALGNLGGTLREQGDLAGALEHLERALALYGEVGDPGSLARIEVSLGLLRTRLGDVEAARRHLEKGLAGARGLRRPPIESAALLGLARLDAQAGDLARARAGQEAALSSLREQGDRDGEVNALAALAATLLRLGERREAAALAREAVERIPELLGGLTETQEAAARERHRGAYEVGAVAAFAASDPEALLFFLESARGASAVAAISGREALQRAAVPAALLEEETKARALEASARKRIERALADEDRDALERARRHLDAAQALVRGAVERIQREGRAAAALLYPRAASLKEIQAALLPGEALLHYALLPKEAAALLVARDSTRIVRIPDADRLALDAASFRPGDGPARESLAARLLGGLELEPSMKRLLIVPSGPLGTLPFALLAPGREVAYVPSGTLLALLRKTRPPPGERVLALGDPDYGGRTGLAPLPASRGEALTVGDETLLGAEATEAGLLRKVASRPRWRAVHLACHGLVEPDRPLRSELALAPDPANDGFLTSLEIHRALFPADLVALSACETARGKTYEAEGVVGLARAFLFAGASRVLVSLWNVDDDATAALMIRFYEEWRRSPCAEALARAQEFVASQERWRDPAYWAAWQLWGLPE